MQVMKQIIVKYEFCGTSKPSTTEKTVQQPLLMFCIVVEVSHARLREWVEFNITHDTTYVISDNTNGSWLVQEPSTEFPETEVTQAGECGTHWNGT